MSHPHPQACQGPCWRVIPRVMTDRRELVFQGTLLCAVHWSKWRSIIRRKHWAANARSILAESSGYSIRSQNGSFVNTNKPSWIIVAMVVRKGSLSLWWSQRCGESSQQFCWNSTAGSDELDSITFRWYIIKYIMYIFVYNTLHPSCKTGQ